MFFPHIYCFLTSFCRVQLDKQNRAKITDLGFCKPEAMMSGSIVGTPIHMAPELFTGALHFTTGVCSPLIVSSFRTAFSLPGKYDNSVDVYAFGILFWYLCAGSVKLPEAFEKCSSKDQLWNNVKKGEGRWRLQGCSPACVPAHDGCCPPPRPGARPERLPCFDEECWQLMEACWNGDPSQRPLLGIVEPSLQSIMVRLCCGSEQKSSSLEDSS